MTTKKCSSPQNNTPSVARVPMCASLSLSSIQAKMRRPEATSLAERVEIVLFDLDDTLLPTDSLRTHRHSPHAVDLTRVDEFLSIVPYEGMLDALLAVSSGMRIGLVTSSPRWYVEQILNRHFRHLRFDPLVTYHDVSLLKPHPEPLLLALQLADVKPENARFVGNAMDDFLACLAAEVSFIGAGWSCLKSFPAQADIECDRPINLIHHIT